MHRLAQFGGKICALSESAGDSARRAGKGIGIQRAGAAPTTHHYIIDPPQGKMFFYASGPPSDFGGRSGSDAQPEQGDYGEIAADHDYTCGTSRPRSVRRLAEALENTRVWHATLIHIQGQVQLQSGQVSDGERTMMRAARLWHRLTLQYPEVGIAMFALAEAELTLNDPGVQSSSAAEAKDRAANMWHRPLTCKRRLKANATFGIRR